MLSGHLPFALQTFMQNINLILTYREKVKHVH